MQRLFHYNHNSMKPNRLEAFSDGALAIIITIMVLELRVPPGSDLTTLRPLIPIISSYILSFIYIGIYWNNHHHLFQAAQKVNGATLWANLHLLFWLSLLPFASGWMGENHFAMWPVALYGVVLLMCAVACSLLTQTLIRHHGSSSQLAQDIGSDAKGKLSLVIYSVAVALAFLNRWLAFGLYICVAIMWFILDRRIEKKTPH